MSAEAKIEALKWWHWSVIRDGKVVLDPDEACKDSECSLCSILLCPHHEPMHLHHDGCPAEYLPHEKTPECDKFCRHHEDDPIGGCNHG